MICCAELDRLLDADLVRNSPMQKLTDGRIVTEIDTEFFLRFGSERPTYAGINYCPFCGRVLSRGLWNLEKKK